MTHYQNIIDKVEALLAQKYEFRKNVVKDKTEYRTAGTQHQFRQVTEYFLNSLKRTAKLEGVKVQKSEIANLLNSNFVRKTDVFREYFESLYTPYILLDENSFEFSYIDSLADTIITTKQELWRKFFKKWLVACVACAIEPEAVNHQVLILTGKQGIGKTRWLERLLPPTLKGYMYSGHISPGNKDTLTMLAENMFINLDELGGMNSNDLDAMKELITKSVIQFRRPYSVYTENYVRRASFMASVNHATFLNDLTGNRRFLPFTVVAANYQHEINIDDVFAEAYQLYKEGFKYWFDENDIPEIEENNEQYYEPPMEQQFIEKWLQPAKEDEPALVATTTEIALLFKQAEGMPMSQKAVQKIGSLLRKLGFSRVKHQGIYKYRYNIKNGNNAFTFSE
jgi:predicted P-loop ATPase